MANTSNRGLGSDNMDEETKYDIQSAGGQASSSRQDMKKLGKKGGQAAQQSGTTHELTEEERSMGGSMSGGNFANDPQRASEAGRKGGSK